MIRHHQTDPHQSQRFSRTGAALLSMVIAVLVSGHLQAQDSNWQVPRTPDGHPDLQGVWANNSSTPLERPEFFGDRAELTDEEFAELLRQAEQIRASGGDALFGDGFLGALKILAVLGVIPHAELREPLDRVIAKVA